MYRLYKHFLSLFFFSSCFFAEVSPGVILFSNTRNFGGSETLLINNKKEIINVWRHDIPTIGIPYLGRDGTLILQFKPYDHTFFIDHGPLGGIFQKLDWGGKLLWQFNFYNDQFMPHHDFEILPNGNILILGWEKKSYLDALEVGRVNIENEFWPLAIYEIKPIGSDSASIVWSWHIWDHLVQDIDPFLENYGVINENVDKIDVNISESSGPDWLHTNSIAYNPYLDHIIFSSRNLNEVFIIDHSTTTEQAASSTGGNSGKGGRIIYRWGNPLNYNRGTVNDQILRGQHGVYWIENDFIGAGELLIFNNNPTDTIGPTGLFGNSSIIQFKPELDINGNYFINNFDIYGPHDYNLVYGGDNSFFSNFQSGAYRMKNGNTFVTVTQQKIMFEIDTLNI